MKGEEKWANNSPSRQQFVQNIKGYSKGVKRALEIWNERRAEVCQSRLSGKEAGDELLRLQAKYAQAYTVLQRHAHNCSVCQLVSRVEGGDPENSSEAPSDSKLYV
jgi:hypothetical protein